MRSHHIRTVGLIVGLIAVLGMASIAVGESLTDQQIGRQIERRLSEDAFSNVNVAVQASVVSSSGTPVEIRNREQQLVIIGGNVLAEVPHPADDLISGFFR